MEPDTEIKLVLEQFPFEMDEMETLSESDTTGTMQVQLAVYKGFLNFPYSESYKRKLYSNCEVIKNSLDSVYRQNVTFLQQVKLNPNLVQLNFRKEFAARELLKSKEYTDSKI